MVDSAGIVRTKVYVHNRTGQPIDVYVGENGVDSTSLYDRSQHDIKPRKSALFSSVRFDTGKENVLFFTDYNPAIRCIRAPCFISHHYLLKYENGALSLIDSDGVSRGSIKNYTSGAPVFVSIDTEGVKIASLDHLRTLASKK
jgi:hypothetical protein